MLKLILLFPIVLSYSFCLSQPRSISALVVFSGDYRGQYEFNGELGTWIPGEPFQAPDYPLNQLCQFKAHFKELVYRKSNHLKMSLQSECSSKDKSKLNSKYKISPLFIQLSDLKSEISKTQISPDIINVQIKVIDLKL